MIGKLLAVLILVLLALYVALSLHLLSFASLTSYGHPYVPPMPANISIQSITHFIAQSFST